MAQSNVEIRTWAPGSGTPRAVWKQTYPYDRSHFHCSRCDAGKRYHGAERLTPYCPNCGAFMEDQVRYCDDAEVEGC